MSCLVNRQFICALAAKQLSLLRVGSIWTTVAASRYFDSLRLLSIAFQEEDFCLEDLLAATMFLSFYELLTDPGLDHRRHVLGATSLIKAYNVGSCLGKLSRAPFFIFVCLDITIALMNECPTGLLPHGWNIHWPTDPDEIEDEMRGNHLGRASRTYGSLYLLLLLQ